MNYKIVKLLPQDVLRIRIGEGRLDKVSVIIHSDTLFSAIVNCYVKLFGEECLDNFINRLLISSLFYGLRISNRTEDILFLPKPIVAINNITKGLKRIEWVSVNLLKDIISSFDGEKAYIDTNRLSFLNPRFVISKEEEFRTLPEQVEFVDTSLEPKVSIERSSNTASNLYFQEELEIKSISLKDGVKLSPFLYFITKDIDRKFNGVLNLLMEEGIGGERSSGKGAFTNWEEDIIDISDTGDYGVLLSLATPRKEEVNNLVYYGLIKRDGFIYYNGPVGIKRKTHFKILEGSLVRLPFIGENIEVSPVEDKRVISYGKGLHWALKVREINES
jgi:CRISPR-associated protein Csm4